MAAKPSKVPVFNTGGANNVEPSVGKKILGWLRGEKPASSTFNWLAKLYGEWAQYLSDGALTGNHTVTGTFGVTGVTTLTGNVGVTGDVAVTGNQTISADLAVADDLTVSGDVDFSGADTIKLPPGDTFFSAGAHGNLQAGTATNNGMYWSGGAVGVVNCWITLPVGYRLTGIDVVYKRNAGTPVFNFYEATYAAFGAVLGTLSVAAGGADATTALGAFVATTVAAGKSYLVQANIGDAGDRYYGIIAHWDKPT